jgi:hypothetical protein
MTSAAASQESPQTPAWLQNYWLELPAYLTAVQIELPACLTAVQLEPPDSSTGIRNNSSPNKQLMHRQPLHMHSSVPMQAVATTHRIRSPKCRPAGTFLGALPSPHAFNSHVPTHSVDASLDLASWILTPAGGVCAIVKGMSRVAKQIAQFPAIALSWFNQPRDHLISTLDHLSCR